MKNQIILFVIGVLVGAVISTGAFYVYTTTIDNCSSKNTQQIGGGQPPEMPGGNNNSNGQPPEMPGNNGNSTQQSNNAQENA